jgi:hypothetical protein
MKVGMTGHQRLGSEATVTWLSDTLEGIIRQYHIDVGITSLAIGADQLYAEVLSKANIPYIAIIPCEGYETTFQNTDDLVRYQELLQKASEKIQLPFEKPSETAFYVAGKKIANLSDVLLTIWNGLPAKGLGGTGDIVKYALSIKKPVVHLNPITQTIREI